MYPKLCSIQLEHVLYRDWASAFDAFAPQAIRLKELPWEFRGGLPASMPDETRMPKVVNNKAVPVDPLQHGQSSKALGIDVSSSLGTQAVSPHQSHRMR